MDFYDRFSDYVVYKKKDLCSPHAQALRDVSPPSPLRFVGREGWK